MYETENDGFFKTFIMVIVALLIFFVFVPWLLNLGGTGSSQPRDMNDTSIYY